MTQEDAEKSTGALFVDGDFDSGKGDCEYHCSPTCHPAQIGPDWKYGCRHPAWPQNQVRDFVPIVSCEGYKAKCEALGIIEAQKRGNGKKKP